MFRIKICGITNVADALAAADAGAEAIGLNFYSKSPRFVDPGYAICIIDAVPELVHVGVVVNLDVATLNQLITKSKEITPTGLSTIQLHGDEPPEYLPHVKSDLILRARRFTDAGISAIGRDLESCRRANRTPDAVLIDAAAPGQYGGTGTTVSWNGLADYRRWLHNVPLILAGGLTPENVAEAIRTVRPHGVDVASGVESSPGKKDPAKVRDFVAAAREAFEQVGEQLR
jgi:phosphoribosylanthranilate isomerase